MCPPQRKSQLDTKSGWRGTRKNRSRYWLFPFEHDLKQVEVRISDLRDKEANEFSAANVDSVVVGYVKTESIPPYGTSHVGWWPDPILDFQSAADVAKHTAQAFWIRVHAPKGQKPGLYEGKMEVVAEDERLFLADLAVQVYGFDVPRRIAAAPGDHVCSARSSTAGKASTTGRVEIL